MISMGRLGTLSLPGGILVAGLLFAGVMPVTLPGQGAPGTPPRVSQWRADLDTLVALVTREHFVHRRNPLPPAFVRGVATLSARVGQFSDERILAEMSRLMVLLGDGHTYLLPAGATRVEGSWLPVTMYLFPDGLYVVDAASGSRDLVGSKVVRIGRVSAADAMRRVAAFIPKDNPMGVQWIAPPFGLRLHGILEAIGAVEPGDVYLDLGMVDRDGEPAARMVRFVPFPGAAGVPKLGPPPGGGESGGALWLRDQGRGILLTRIVREVLYLRMLQVRDTPEETLADLAKRLGDSLSIPGTTALILDLRLNNGGNADLLGPLLDTLRAYDRQCPDCRILVLTGRNTFSAAQILLNVIDRDTRAIVVGEPSSSRPNFVGEENFFRLPWSGAIGSISDRYHESRPGDRRRWIPPDVPVDLTAADYFGHRDPVLDAALRRALRDP
ncbi:MAG: hypothetical protein KC544_08045 [Gemmatimonadetes bacterium]|nr:hypothetical protein [Gemmatimonadota bacterium]MCA9768509.1 hypothetical protein [Gemmatimonadota bacterium]